MNPSLSEAIFGTVFYICAPIVLAVYLGKGYFALSARRYLIRGAELAKQSEFELARRAVLTAARQNPKFKKNVEVQNLYEIILSKSATATAGEIDRIILAVSTESKSRAETIVESDGFKFGMVIFWIIWLLVKFAH